MIGLLTLAGIPTTIAIAEGISEQHKQNDKKKDDKLLRQFTLRCWCDGKSPGKRDIHGGAIVVGDDKVSNPTILSPHLPHLPPRHALPTPHLSPRLVRCAQPPLSKAPARPQVWVQSPRASPQRRLHRFEGFYIAYPDDERGASPPLGLVTKVTDEPPLMNWLYVDRFTSEVKHGNRSASRAHRVGDWGHTNQDSDGEEIADAEDAGGVDLDGAEQFVAVQPRPGDAEGRWEVYWDQQDDKLGEGKEVEGRRVLRISLERTFMDEG